MEQITESISRRREQWESECLAVLARRLRDVDLDEARKFIAAAWSIERFRTLTPSAAAAWLLENPAVRPATR
jgi:predicted RNA polymerase sigma factor